MKNTKSIYYFLGSVTASKISSRKPLPKRRPLKVEETSDSQTHHNSILKENIPFVKTQTSSLNQKTTSFPLPQVAAS